MNSLMDLSNISVAKAVELEQIRHSFLSEKGKSEYESQRKVKYKFASNFSDSKFDRENGFEPVAHQWFNLNHLQECLIGMSKRAYVNTRYFNVEAK